MTELLTCRRPTDQGDDTTCQKELPAHNTAGPTHKADGSLPAADRCRVSAVARTPLDVLPFAEIWAVDFEFGSEPGENPEPASHDFKGLRPSHEK